MGLQVPVLCLPGASHAVAPKILARLATGLAAATLQSSSDRRRPGGPPAVCFSTFKYVSNCFNVCSIQDLSHVISFLHLISFGSTAFFLRFPYAPTLGEPRCEDDHCRGPKGFQQTQTCAAPVIGEQQLDPSASGPFRRQEALSGVGQRTVLHSSAASGSHAMTHCDVHNSHIH